jgi:hypothetical protein
MTTKVFLQSSILKVLFSGVSMYHENRDSDCLLKTQDSAKFYNDV